MEDKEKQTKPKLKAKPSSIKVEKYILPLPEVSLEGQLKSIFAQHFSSVVQVADRKNRNKVVGLLNSCFAKYKASIIHNLEREETKIRNKGGA
jgi:hypothetical protein